MFGVQTLALVTRPAIFTAYASPAQSPVHRTRVDARGRRVVRVQPAP